ncbi:hypothetical protein, partial [Micromonospora sp. NPDC023644]|uniref:hypothetical protein n=1 Tax=Micromonospora sp. NPDC023644 TaxID=3154321 RepID=UPI003405A59A
MAFRTWGRLLLTALGVSLLVGAGQLGIAFGFGIVRLTGTFTGTTVNQWPAQLVWAGWFAANAAVVGAVLTERLARRDGGLVGTGRILAVAGAAALGATVVAPLCMQPARAAELVSVDPVWAVGICAVLGALVGAGAALAVLLQPPVGWNMAAVAGAIWLLALVSVAPSLFSTGPLDTVRLGVLEPASLDADAAQRLALVVLPLVALLAGAATGGLARWRGHPPLVSGATGVAGPVLVAFAYLTAGPGDTADRYQLTPYYAALLAVAAGALGSAAAALLRWPLVTRTAPTGAIEPTDILRPLPTGPALPRTPAHSGGDEPETVDLAGATLAGAEPAGGTGSGAVTAAGDAPAPRAVPPHWDWPAQGGTVPAPAADAPADPQWTAVSPADNPPAADRPAGPAPAPTPGGADDHAPAALTVPATPAAEAAPTGQATPAAQPAGETTPAGRPTGGATPSVQPVEAATPAGEPAAGEPAAGEPRSVQPVEGLMPSEQPADGTTPAAEPAGAAVGQQPAPGAPKPRRTRKPRSPRQPAVVAPENVDPAPAAVTPEDADPTPAAVTPEDAGWTPAAAGAPATEATTPVAAVPPASPDASAVSAPAPGVPTAEPATTSPTGTGAQPATTTGAEPGATAGTETGAEPGATAGTGTGAEPGATAGTGTGAEPGATAGTGTGAEPDTTTGAQPGTTTGAEPGTAAGAEPGPATGAEPGTTAGA